MTAVAAALPRRRQRTTTAVDVPPLGGGMHLVRGGLVVVFMLSLSLLLQLLVISALQQRAAQQRAYDSFRADLAEGTAPVGAVDSSGHVLATGSPMAYLEIPAIGLRQVVVEGTTPSTLFSGPGHRRDTPFPGQPGSSVIYGRRGAFGGPFSRVDDLDEGDVVRVTTAQGEFDYRVLGVRHEGEPVPDPPQSDEGRLVLATAAGRPFMPSGVLRVDAVLESDVVTATPRPVSAAALPANEQLMASDTSTLWALALWIQALTVATLGAVWAWHRWGRAPAWVVFFPVLLLVGLNTASEAARLMPNLL